MIVDKVATDTIPVWKAEIIEKENIKELLDKIKAEVIARDRNVKTVRSDGRCLFTAEEILEIIDKYKAESEEKNENHS